MSNRAKYPAQSYGIGRVYGEFQMTLAGSATSVTVSEGKEFVSKVVHVGGTNIWTVTLADPYQKVVAHAVDVRDDTPNGAYATIGTFTNENSTSVPPANVSFKIQTWTAGGGASNDSTLVVCVTLAIRDSSVTIGN